MDQFTDPRYLILLALTAIAFALLRPRLYRTSHHPLPPGPPRYPILGNLLQFVKHRGDPYQLFSQWAREYGDVVYFSILGKDNLLISSPAVARQLLEKRGATYADRPSLVYINDVLGWANNLVTMRYGDQFRKQRRMMQPLVNEKAMQSYLPLQEDYVATLLQSIVESPALLKDHLNTYTSMIFQLTYGLSPKTHPELIHLADQTATRTLQAFNSLGSPVDIFPILRFWPVWAPISPFQRDVADLRRCVLEANNVPYEIVKEKMRTEVPEKSFVADAIAACGGPDDLTQEDERDIRGVSGILYVAAQETTANVLHAFFLAMMLFPQVQRQAQAELDTIVPSGVPTFDDRPQLTYLEAVFKELFRWTSPSLINPPHAATTDDTYNGYRIPRGTIIIVDILAMFNACPSPTEFKPERFLDGTDLGEVPADPRDIVFGFGRRRCPGMHVAERVIWLAIARILPVFDILGPHPNSTNIDIDSFFQQTMISRSPVPFQCRIVPRTSASLKRGTLL